MIGRRMLRSGDGAGFGSGAGSVDDVVSGAVVVVVAAVVVVAGAVVVVAAIVPAAAGEAGGFSAQRADALEFERAVRAAVEMSRGHLAARQRERR